MSHNGARFDDRRRGTHLNKEDDSGGHRGRRRGMHHDTQRAMIGVAYLGMGVSYLDDRQQRQQDNAHHRCNREASRRITAGSSPFWP